MSSTFGKLFRIQTFGESHGPGIGVVIDGCPAGLEIDLEEIQKELNRRRPGQSDLTTQRDEKDRVKCLSGIFEGKSTGSPIALYIENEEHRSEDYAPLKDVYRPSHADYTYEVKYGHRDYRGGGRASARETAGRVMAGAVANQLIRTLHNVDIRSYVSGIGHIALEKDYHQLDLASIENSPVRCPDQDISNEMVKLINEVKTEGDSLGGVISCVIKNVPVGLGEPAFDKLHADMGKAMLSINAVKGFEIGSGFAGSEMKGSEHNDEFINKDGTIGTETNRSGGVQGGISNGEDIFFKVGFKPTATIFKSQSTVDKQGREVDLKVKGRHDPCVLPRAVPIVDAMAALVIADFILRARTSKMT